MQVASRPARAVPETSDERLLRRVLLIKAELHDKDFEITFKDSRGSQLDLSYEQVEGRCYDYGCEPLTLTGCFHDLTSADSIDVDPNLYPGECASELGPRAHFTPARFKAPSWDYDFVPSGHLAKLGPSNWHKQPSTGQAGG